MEISRKSTLTGQDHTLDIDVTQEQIDRWEAGELIQNVMPHLSRHEREFIMSGITGEEWEKYFGSIEKD